MPPQKILDASAEDMVHYGSGNPPAIDVYDVAAWMATTALSEQSIALGSAPVYYPDFTNGKWMTRGRDTASGKYAL